MQKTDTIAAISTPIGKAGIGIVRLSGPRAVFIAERMFAAKDGKKARQFKSHTLHYGWIKNGDSPRRNDFPLRGQPPFFVDEVLLTVMRAPATYTREDIVEINCHSGPAALKRTFELTVKNGARPAAPGEFTRRAFLNGRIDLAKAEAVLDVVNAGTQKALAVAENQLKGKLSARLADLRGRLVDALADIEASLDFSHEDIDALDRQAVIGGVRAVNEDLRLAIERSAGGIALREGVRIVIAGKPNAGKSSLLNSLAGIERAIVTPVAGTTRDTIEHAADINGIPATLVDTAGITAARGIVDKLSVQKSLDSIAAAEIILFLLDGSRPLSDEDERILKALEGKNFITVINKIDLPQKIGTVPDMKYRGEGGCPQILKISATKGTGLDGLRKAISDFFWKGASSDPEDILITNARHKKALEEASALLKKAVAALAGHAQEELASVDIREAAGKIDEITGRRIGEEVLDRIFSQFCIGK